MGNTLIMERVLNLGGAVVEPKGIIKHTYLIPLSTVITVHNRRNRINRNKHNNINQL
ncbi:hypothetical protein [Spiroplasma sp. ChiS]|uniref:hypothetical protein n=1 Tax=Spiroplasma sp. ChiS TaxID=2099885 RepID=UPI00139244A9|nr:hypothetical protein [Spiroplasma sp. ChiS]